MSYPDPYLGGRAPEVDFYNFGLQYEVYRNLTVSANYVGSQVHFLQDLGARGLQAGQINPSYAPLANVGGTVNAVGGVTGGTNYLAQIAMQTNINAAQAASGISLPIPYAGYPLAAAAKGATSAISISHMLTGRDRTDLMETSRKEIDTMVNLSRLLKSTTEPILDLAPTPEEGTIMRLGPNITTQIKHKIDVMNAHWRDYDRLSTAPNP